MNILVTIPDSDFRSSVFDKEMKARLEGLGTVHWNTSKNEFSKKELEQLIRTFDVCIIGWHVPQITKEMVVNTPLKFIGYIGGSLKSVISRDIFETDLKVVGCNATFAKPLAEYTLMLILMSLRRAYTFIAEIKTEKNTWSNIGNCVNSLYGKTVGLIGYGSIAAELVSLLQPFDVRIIVCDEYCSTDQARMNNFSLVNMEELLVNSDVVSIHHTLTEKTYHMLDKKALEKMKDEAILVNTARGAIIDENDLVDELQKGRLFAALDVYEHEPLPNESLLRKLPNVIALPHVGGDTRECKIEMAKVVINDLIRFKNGKYLLNLETKERYDLMTEKLDFKKTLPPI